MDRNKRYELGLYEKSMPNDLSWEEKLTVTRDSGFDYLEMSVDESKEKLARLDWGTDSIQEVLDAMMNTGIRIRSMCLSGHRKYPLGSRSQEDQERALDIMRKAIDLAEVLGIRIIQLAGYDVYYEPGDETTRDHFVKNLRSSVEMAARKGIVLGFETMETPFMDTVEKAMSYVKDIRNAYLGIYPDIGNLKNASLLYGVSVNEDLRKGKGHLFAAHLKETLPGHYREIPFGTGHTEFKENIRTLYDLGVYRFVGEFWYTGSPTWRQDVKEAAIFLRDKLEQ